MSDTICTVEGCGRPHKARGLCGMHYARVKRHGRSGSAQFERIVGDDASRFWSKVEKSDDCWNWTGTAGPRGYGQFYVNSRKVPAHRYSYELNVGPIPSGLVVDHLCRNRMCVNPDHLEPVTNRENILRGEGVTAKAAVVTHCPRGHAYAGENLRIDRKGNRLCRECGRAFGRQYYANRRAAAAAAAETGGKA